MGTVGHRATPDKKSKKLFLISHRQAAKANLKAISKEVGVKELRLAKPDDVAKCLKVTRGCITALCLINADPATITYVLDSELETSGAPLTICAGCNNPLDHTQHQVVRILPAQLAAILADAGHTPKIITI